VNQVKSRAAAKLDIQENQVWPVFGQVFFSLLYGPGLADYFYFRLRLKHPAQVFPGKGLVIHNHGVPGHGLFLLFFVNPKDPCVS
jgi:hypothetical protein